jgi:hypothetical protein
MIKVTTHSGTIYIIDENNKRIKRVPRPGTSFDSILRGMINVGEWQPFTSINTFGIGGVLYVTYPNEQTWTRSTLITEIEYEYEENGENT